MSPSSDAFAVPSPLPGLKRWRRFRELTQSQLAEAVGVHQATICAWELGRQVPRLDQARILVRILEAPSLEALFPGSDPTGAAA